MAVIDQSNAQDSKIDSLKIQAYRIQLQIEKLEKEKDN